MVIVSLVNINMLKTNNKIDPLKSNFSNLTVGEKLVIEREFNKKLLDDLHQLKIQYEEKDLQLSIVLKQYDDLVKYLEDNEISKTRRSKFNKNQSLEIRKLTETIFKLREKLIKDGLKNIKI
jgi:hypothetical protein